eukprot:TRINITY_DN3730_c0_g1_i1.p1 TRINITY_DN3730_c0_g1~~TRINITY_DN3730_c0_g1_i1.p1  ORF type:complete len:213 (-),score=38.45 TRINITY_DN3730_c0_g1_i1:48-686(-)
MKQQGWEKIIHLKFQKDSKNKYQPLPIFLSFPDETFLESAYHVMFNKGGDAHWFFIVVDFNGIKLTSSDGLEEYARYPYRYVRHCMYNKRKRFFKIMLLGGDVVTLRTDKGDLIVEEIQRILGKDSFSHRVLSDFDHERESIDGFYPYFSKDTPRRSSLPVLRPITNTSPPNRNFVVSEGESTKKPRYSTWQGSLHHGTENLSPVYLPNNPL